LNEVQRGRAVRSVFYVEAFGFERAADDFTESRFVVDCQHGGSVCRARYWVKAEGP
jgi:hypothetical protein